MAVAYRSTAISGAASGGNLTATEPTGAAAGDILLAVFCQDSVTANICLPAGWHEIDKSATVSSFTYVVGWIRRGNSAPDLTFTTNTAATYREVVIVALSGGEHDAWGAQWNSATGTADPTAAEGTTTSAVSVAMAYCWLSWASTPGAPTGYTLRAGSAGGKMAIATKTLSAAGSEDPSAFTGGTSTSDFYAITWIIKDLVNPPSPGVAVAKGDWPLRSAWTSV